jgi:hypothetical protein
VRSADSRLKHTPLLAAPKVLGDLLRHAATQGFTAGMIGQSVSSKVLLQEYWEALRQTPQIFKRTAFRRRTLEEELQEVGKFRGH